MTESSREPVDIEIRTAAGERLVITPGGNIHGRHLVAVTPERLGCGYEWRPRPGGLVLEPAHARRLAAALVEMAATIEPPEPSEPQPTEADREASRWP